MILRYLRLENVRSVLETRSVCALTCTTSEPLVPQPLAQALWAEPVAGQEPPGLTFLRRGSVCRKSVLGGIYKW